MKQTAEARAEAKYPNSIKYGIFDSVSNIQFRKVYATCIREEVEPLEAWKESAIKVMGEWDKVWTALGNPGKVGESTAAVSLVAVLKLLVLVQAVCDNNATAEDARDALLDAQEMFKQAGFVPTNTTEG